MIILIILIVVTQNTTKKEKVADVTPTPTIKNDKPIVWWRAEAKDLILIDNTKDLKSSKQLASEAGCLAGINAFYYDQNNKPLGWLVINNQLNNKSHKSNLLNGFLYVKNNRFYISDKMTKGVIYGHQAGPTLISNFKFQISNLDDLVADRRSVAIQTEDDQTVFVWVEEATLAGLPEILTKLAMENGFTVKNAINLDGGNSSAIWTEEESRRETFFAGGFWCKSGVLQ